jgi:hypothetical protein
MSSSGVDASSTSRNPYAAPTVQDEPTFSRRWMRGRALSFAYGAAWGTDIALRIAERLAGRPRVLSILVGIDDFLAFALAAAWLRAAWKGIPPGHRGKISPRRAWVSLFVPVYGLYWGVAINLALCDTLNSILEHARSTHKAPRLLGVFANAFAYAPPLYAVFAPWSMQRGLLGWMPESLALVDAGLWFVYMMLCDDARLVVARMAEDADALPAPRLSRVQRSSGPTLAICAFILLALAACWVLVQPSVLDSR